MRKIALLCLFMVACFASARASEPVFSATRLSAAVGADYAFYGKSGDQPLPEFEKSWEFGVYGAYTLVAPAQPAKVPILSLAGSAAYDVDNKWMRYRLGLRLVVFRGGGY